MRGVVGTGIVAVAAAATLSAENWPQWRGPALNGVSAEKGIPLKWSPTENIAWKLAMPACSGSTPIIWGDTSSSTSARPTAAATSSCGRSIAPDGEVLWKRPLAGGNHRERKQNMSSPSPVTDGQTVWVMTGVGVLKAFDFTGKELWARDIQKDYGRFGLNWGYASSPLLHDDALYVQVLHGMKTDDPSYVLRIDGKTREDALARRAADRRPSANRRMPTPRRRCCDQRAPDDRDRHHRRRRRHRARSRDRQGAVAAERPQPANDPDYRIVASPLVVRRHRHRADARAAAAGDQGRRQRRRHRDAPAVELRQRPGRADAGQRRQAALRRQRPRRRLCARREDRRGVYGPQRLRPAPTARRRCWPTARSTSPARTRD